MKFFQKTFLIMYINLSASQTLNTVAHKIDSLQTIEIRLTNELHFIQSESDKLNELRLSLLLKKDLNEGITVSVLRDARILDKPDALGNEIFKI